VAGITAELLRRLHTEELLSGCSSSSLANSAMQLLDLVEAHDGQTHQAQPALLQALTAAVEVATASGVISGPQQGCAGTVAALLSARSNTVRTAGVQVLRALLTRPEEATAAATALLRVWVAAQAGGIKSVGGSAEEAAAAFAVGLLLRQATEDPHREQQGVQSQQLQLLVWLLREVLPLLQPAQGPQDAAALVQRLAAQLLARLLRQQFPRTAGNARAMGVLRAAACYLQHRGSDGSAREAAAAARSARQSMSCELVLGEAAEWVKVARQALQPGQVGAGASTTACSTPVSALGTPCTLSHGQPWHRHHLQVALLLRALALVAEAMSQQPDDQAEAALGKWAAAGLEWTAVETALAGGDGQAAREARQQPAPPSRQLPPLGLQEAAQALAACRRGTRNPLQGDLALRLSPHLPLELLRAGLAARDWGVVSLAAETLALFVKGRPYLSSSWTSMPPVALEALAAAAAAAEEEGEEEAVGRQQASAGAGSGGASAHLQACRDLARLLAVLSDSGPQEVLADEARLRLAAATLVQLLVAEAPAADGQRWRCAAAALLDLHRAAGLLDEGAGRRVLQALVGSRAAPVAVCGKRLD
jgi:hypothetical protein